MIQSSAANPGILDQIVALLVTRFHPIRIFLFGSRARGDFRSDSDYDLLLEIERLPEGVSITGEDVTSLDDFPDTEVQLHLRSPGQLELKQDDPGTIDWDVAREGQLLYSITGPSRADARHVREPRHTPPDSLESWLRFARRDLMHARHHLDDELEDWSDEICFYAQQSAEKIIKALIVSARQRPERTHDLAALLAHARAVGFPLQNLDEPCELLSRYAVEPRYPGGNRTRAEAGAAVEAAERIAAVTQSHLA